MVPASPSVPCGRQPSSCVQVPPPGALRSVPGPQLAIVMRSPSMVWEVTATTPSQLAGVPMVDAPIAGAAPSLPVAATTTAPAARAALMADCMKAGQAPEALRLRLMTRAGVVLVGMLSEAQVPLSGCAPDAQRMASAMLVRLPPHLPSTRTGRILASYATPGRPMLLSPTAAIRPAMAVPCHELEATVQPAKTGNARSPAATQSPGSVGSGSRPSPSLATRNAPSTRSARTKS